jgi:hypothetical protein
MFSRQVLCDVADPISRGCCFNFLTRVITKVCISREYQTDRLKTILPTIVSATKRLLFCKPQKTVLLAAQLNSQHSLTVQLSPYLGNARTNLDMS